MTEILLEKKLTTEFTMGFELECIWYVDGWDEANDRAKRFFNQWFPGGDLHSDGSLDYTYEKGGEPIEWASPVLPVNVSTFQRIINMYKAGLDDEFYVNSTCGYHHHLSFQGITAEDVIWIMSKLALDDNMRRKISKFKGIEFVGEWSRDDYIDDLKNAVLNDNYKKIVELCKTDKYSLVNVHNHNTLEWRGPRGFLEDGSISTIIDFYKLLWEFVKWMTDVLDETEINNVSKDNFIAQIRAVKGSSNINGFKFSEKRKDGLLSDDKLKEICKKISDEPKILANFVKSKALEQILQHLFNTNRLGKRVVLINQSEELRDEIKHKINNLCYKYIPYRMLVQFRDSIDSDTIYNTSDLTLKRFIKTNKLDGSEITLANKIQLLSNNVSEMNPAIINKDIIPEIYDNDEWDIVNATPLFKVMVQNGSIKDITPEVAQDMLSGIDEEAFTTKLKILSSIFKNNVEFKKTLHAAVVEHVVENPKEMIPLININEKEVMMIIGDIFRSADNKEEKIEELHQALVQNNKMSEEDWSNLIHSMRRPNRIINRREDLSFDEGDIEYSDNTEEDDED